VLPGVARQVLPGLATLDYARRFMQIRMASESDAEASLRLLGRLDHETQFMMYEPEERTTNRRGAGGVFEGHPHLRQQHGPPCQVGRQ
jgi:hypothetical protein